MDKAVILPILAFLKVMLELLFGIKIPDEIFNDFVNQFMNFGAICLVLYGIFKNYKKDKDKK